MFGNKDTQPSGAVYVQSTMTDEEREIAGIAHKTVAATMRLININDEGQYNSAIESQLRTLEELLANLL